MSIFEKAENMLSEKKIPPTPMRLLVLNEFLKSEAAISLSDLEDALSQSDRSTLYRTLKTFEKKGLLHSIQENNTTQYLLCQHCGVDFHNDTHLHFFCIRCKKTICLENTNFILPRLPKGFEVIEYKLVANGICPDCSILQ